MPPINESLFADPLAEEEENQPIGGIDPSLFEEVAPPPATPSPSAVGQAAPSIDSGLFTGDARTVEAEFDPVSAIPLDAPRIDLPGAGTGELGEAPIQSIDSMPPDESTDSGFFGKLWEEMRDDLTIGEDGRYGISKKILDRDLEPVRYGFKLGVYPLAETVDYIIDRVVPPGVPIAMVSEAVKNALEPTDAEAPSTLPGKILAGVFGAAPVEVTKFVTGAKVGEAIGGGISLLNWASRYASAITLTSRTAGVAGIGAFQEIPHGPAAMAYGAAEYALLDGVLQAAAPLPRFTRGNVVGGVFGAQAAIQGGSTEDRIAAFAAGFALAQMGGPGNQRLSVSEKLRTKIRNSETFKKSYAKRQAALVEADREMLIKFSEDVAQEFLRTEYPDVYAKLQGTKVGDITIDSPRKAYDIKGMVSRNIDNALGVKQWKGTEPSLRDKVDYLIKKNDPHKLIPENERLAIADRYAQEVDALHNTHYTQVKERMTALSQRSQQARAGQQAQAVATEKADAQRVNRVMSSSREAARAQAMQANKRVSSRLKDVIDFSAEIKARLIKEGGAVGHAAVRMKELAAGATNRAQMIFQDAVDTIYGAHPGAHGRLRGVLRLSQQDMRTLSDIVTIRNILEIEKRLPASKKGGKFKHVGNITESEARNWLRNLERELGPQRFAEMNSRADLWFGETRKVLERLQREGLASQELYNKIKDYNWSPTEYINFIDPPIEGRAPRGMSIDVRESGIARLDLGSTGPIQTDSYAMLAQVIARAENRIALNRANRKLLDFGRQVPENTIVKLPKAYSHDKDGLAKLPKGQQVPKGYKRVNAWEEGKQKPIFIREEFYEQWKISNPGINQHVANITRILSGSSLVRPLATGFNPEFILVNLPRDIVHSWIVTNEYSPVMPLAALQIGADLIRTGPDVWLRRGRYRQYIEEGGGMSFLSHQGRDFFDPIRSDARKQLDPRLLRMKQVLGYLNETSELMVRVALRDRVLRNRGIDPSMGEKIPYNDRSIATWVARNYLDFSQGGQYIKGVDHAVPYLNAAMQATRGVVRGARNNPISFTAKMSQLMALSAGLWLANRFTNPEALSQMSDYEKIGNFYITLPIYTLDPSTGDKRWLYMKLRLDESLTPVHALTQWSLERYVDGKVPNKQASDRIGELVGKFVPFSPSGVLPPTLAAILAYKGYDVWYDKSVWGGRDVKSAAEYRLAPDKPTPEFYKDLASIAESTGDFLGLPSPVSPERTQAAVRRILPRNVYTELVGSGFQALLYQGQDDVYESAKLPEQVFAEHPFIRKLVNLTHPLNRDDPMLSEVLERNATREDVQNRRLDELLFKEEQGKASREEIRNFVREQPREDRERLFKRWENTRELDRILSKDGTLPGRTSRNWWIRLDSADPGARAEAFYIRYVEGDADERRAMWRLAMRLGFQNDRQGEFLSKFRKLVHERGDEAR